MATRVNKKLLFVVLTCTAITAGVVGVLGLQAYRADATRFIRAGDAEAAKGDFRKASAQYGRAIGKQPNNVEFHTKFIDASRKVVPETANEAGEKYNQLVASLRKRAQIARTNPELWHALLDEIRNQCEFFSSVPQWQFLYNLVGSDLVSVLAADDPLMPMAKAYHGYAQSQRVEGLAPEEVDLATAELESAIEKGQGAELDLAYGALLSIRHSQALALATAGKNLQAEAAWKTHDELLAKALAAMPDGIEVRRAEFLRLITRRDAGDKTVDQAAIKAAIDRLATMALASDNGTAVYVVLRAIGASGPAGNQPSVALLDAYLAKHPESLLHRRVLAKILQGVDLARAEAEAKTVLTSAQQPIGFTSAAQDDLRVDAAQQIFDLHFNQLGTAADDKARKETLARLEADRNQIADLIKGLPDDSVLIKTDGKLAFAKGDHATAAVRFNEVVRRGSMVDAELFSLASANAEAMNSPGQALIYLDEAIKLSLERKSSPFVIAAFLERKGILEHSLGRYQEAIRTLGPIVERDPSRGRAKAVLADSIKAVQSGAMPSKDDPILQAVSRAQAAFDRKDYATAREAMMPLLEKSPYDLRLIKALIQTEYADGKKEAALALVDRGLAIDPADRDLVRWKASIPTDDPVVRVEAAIAQLYPNDPERSVWTYVRMENLLDGTKKASEDLAQSNPAESKRLAGLVPSLQAATDSWRGKALAADAQHPAIHDHEFSKAIDSKDWKAAEAAISAAETAKRDPTLPLMLRARLAVAQGNYGQAADLSRRALDSNVDTADVWRILGFAQDQMGDVASAVHSFGEAYKRNPKDMNVVRGYVAVLTKSGERGQALTILREARRVAGDDTTILDLWTNLEAEIGDRRMARGMRETRYTLFPGDTGNALALASLLAESQPERADVTDTKGAEKFTDPQWRALDEATRAKELDRIRDDWRARSDAIFKQLLDADPGNVDLNLLRAAIYRKQAKYAEAEAALKGMIARAGDKPSALMYVALGVHYAETDDLAKATVAFDEAVKRQDPATREADASIGEYWFQKTQWERAIPFMQRYAEVAKTPNVAMRLAETYARLHQYDKARQQLASAAAGGKHDPVIDQLEASICEGRGDELASQGKKDDAFKSYGEAIEAIKRAREAAANNPIVYVQEAVFLKKQFDVSGDRTRLDAAMAAADKAVKLRADLWPAAQAKAELYLAASDAPSCVAELERFAKAAPSNADGRRRLLEILVALGNSGRAIEAAREAIALSPNDPQWRVALGEIELRAGHLDEAIVAYEAADKLRPSSEYLHRLTDLRLRKTPPTWSTVLASLRERPDDVRNSPYLQSAIGAALVNTKDEKKGLDAMRESYRFAKRAVAEGIQSSNVIDGWYSNLRLVYPAARSAEVETFVNEVSEGKPDATDYRWLAESWFASGGNGAARTVELAAKGLAIDSKKDPELTARLYDMTGSAKYSLGDCKGALDAFRSASAALPQEPSLLNNFAFLVGECGDNMKEGIEAARKAIQLAPARAEYHDTLGFLIYKDGNPKEATETLMRSLKIAPSASANFHLAQILLEAGQKDEARTYLNAAGDLKPDPVLQKQINALIEKLR